MFSKEEYAENCLKLFKIHQNQKFDELLYYIYFNKILHSYGNSCELNTFRFLFDPNSNILTIKYFELQGLNFNPNEFISTKKYISEKLIFSDPIIADKTPYRSKIFLKRNLKYKNSSKPLILSNQIIHKIVLFFML